MPESSDALVLAALAVVPGYLAIFAFEGVIARRERSDTRYILEAIAVSLAFWLLLYPTLLTLRQWSGIQLAPAVTLAIAAFSALIVPPMLGWCAAHTARMSTDFTQRLGFRPLIPRAWDHKFSQNEHLYLIITMSDGTRLGGYYSANSFASSYPTSEDLFVEKVVRLDEDGRFAHVDRHSAGAWVSATAIQFIEFYTPLEPTHEQQETA